MNSPHPFLLPVVAGLAFFAMAMAQSVPSDEIHSQTVPYIPASPVTLRTEVRVVEVPAVVRDQGGRTVPGLTRDAFKVYDDGKLQTITGFSVRNSGAERSDPAGNPRFIALCFDDLHLQSDALKRTKDAAEQFVRAGLSPGDRAAIITTSHSGKYDFSSDVPTLLGQIEKLTATPQRAAADMTRCPLIRPYEAYQIAARMDPGNQVLEAKMAECQACYNNPCHEGEIVAKAETIWSRARDIAGETVGVIDGLVDGMAKLPGQRIVILTSAGFLAGGQETHLDRVMDKARHSEVVINALDANGLSFSMSGNIAYEGAAVLASGTGGSFFHNSNDLKTGFRDLGTAPETIYAISFTPSGPMDGRFHGLRVQLAGSNRYSVQARLGYAATPQAVEKTSGIDNEVTASNALTEFPVSFRWEQWQGKPGMTVVVSLDIAHMHFMAWNGRHTEKLNIIGVLLDDSGNVVAGKKSELQFSFRDATLAQFAKTGFTTAMTIEAAPGHYVARAVAQETLEGKLAAASTKVEIR